MTDHNKRDGGDSARGPAPDPDLDLDLDPDLDLDMSEEASAGLVAALAAVPEPPIDLLDAIVAAALRAFDEEHRVGTPDNGTPDTRIPVAGALGVGAPVVGATVSSM